MLQPLLASLTHEPAICTHVHAASIRLGATSYTVKAFVTRCGKHVVLCYKFLLITELEWAKYSKKRKKKEKKWKCHWHLEVTLPMLPLNNELESC